MQPLQTWMLIRPPMTTLMTTSSTCSHAEQLHCSAVQALRRPRDLDCQSLLAAIIRLPSVNLGPRSFDCMRLTYAAAIRLPPVGSTVPVSRVASTAFARVW